MYSVSDRWMN